MSRQTERYESRKADKAAMPKGPSGIRPTRFLPPMPGFPNGVLMTRANLHRAIYLTSATFRRAKRPKKVENGRVSILHETKGWQSARVAH